MSAGEVFSGSFLAALGALLAWVITLLVVRPALEWLVTAARATLVRRETFAPLAPGQAVERYLASGCSIERGMPTLKELQWLLSLTTEARFAWALGVVACVEQQLGVGKPEAYTMALDDLGLMPNAPLRSETHGYLETVAQGFPIVGVWRWSRS